MGTFRPMFTLVVAKEPVPGRVKTRLCPPCTEAEAAAIAEAALHDTFEAVVAAGPDEIIVALDGSPGPWIPAGARIVAQIDGPFDRRLAAAWASTAGPGIQVGMDTPQMQPEDLRAAMALLETDEHDAVLGFANDGGWWIIGLPDSDDRVFVDIPMSRPDTGSRQLARLESLGHRVGVLPTMIDVDHFPEALDVAATRPNSRFAAAVAGVAAVGAGAS